MSMTRLDEEKKLATEWLGYGVKVDHKYSDKYVWSDTYDTYKTHHHFGCTFDEWNPQDNETGRSWWDEIWRKMFQGTAEMWEVYSQIFVNYYNNQRTEKQVQNNPPLNFRLLFHTAKPEVCWKAFIMTLEILFKQIK